MHRESIQMYCIPSRRVIRIASWNVLGRMLSGISRFLPSKVERVVVTMTPFPLENMYKQSTYIQEQE